MDAVDGLMRGLRLSEEERRGVNFKILVREKGKTMAAQAVGKVLSEKLAHPDAIRLSLGRVWCPIKGIDCKEVGENLFVFRFNQESGKRRALEDGPWMFEKDLVVVEDYDPRKRPEDYAFNEVPI
ncbi:LRR receptor-like serine/threonine-protein kinase FLS2 [Hordeum vulgare]|nr:LRR receptor-like serine/threonine-protein kinase FLS2 [Hordeum vulgare]